MKRVMVVRSLLFAGAALALAGCYTAPAEPYAYDYPPGGYYAPTYYGAPAYYGPGYYAPRRPVQNTFVFSYTDRDHGRDRRDRRSHSRGRWD